MILLNNLEKCTKMEEVSSNNSNNENTEKEEEIVTSPPVIDRIDDVKNFKTQIRNFVHQNPDKDHVYFFPNHQKRHERYESIYPVLAENQGCSGTTVVAGSTALVYIQQLLSEGFWRDWEANDADVFVLKSSSNSRMSLGKIDIVAAKENTVEGLLLNFDMGCCRAAFDFQMNIWVSIQCLASCLFKTYPMPSYVSNEGRFVNFLRKHRGNSALSHDAEKVLYKRLLERIEKYKKRGYEVRWVGTEVVLPWIKNRFHYAEWNIPNESQNTLVGKGKEEAQGGKGKEEAQGGKGKEEVQGGKGKEEAQSQSGFFRFFGY